MLWQDMLYVSVLCHDSGELHISLLLCQGELRKYRSIFLRNVHSDFVPSLGVSQQILELVDKNINALIFHPLGLLT